MNFKTLFRRRPDEPAPPNIMGTAPVTRIRLLENVIENGGVKLTRRRQQADGTYLVDIAWAKGTIIDVSNATGEKYVTAGKAEWVRP